MLTTSPAGVVRTPAAVAYMWHSVMKVEPRWAHMRDTQAAVWAGAPAVLGGGHSASWSDKEVQQLKSLVKRDGARLKDWSTKAELLGTGRSEVSVKQYYYKRLRAELAVEAAMAERESGGAREDKKAG